MEQFQVHITAASPAPGTRRQASVGVNASGNIELLVERVLPATECLVEVTTAVTGFRDLWQAVIEDFCERCPTGGLRFAINDGGARPDAVHLRLMQGAQAMGADA
jgi:malonate decarboxylase delta subunit